MSDKTEKFIQKAMAVHGDLYDYSKAEYTRAIDKVVIICKKHGEFNQAPSEHIKGRGCRSCGFERMTTADFIKKAQAVHGEKYDYSKSEFINSHAKTTVICKTHGEFLASPNSHQSGSGCPKCGSTSRGQKNANKARDKFIAKATVVHGNAIDFCKTQYVTAKEKALFVCPKHGEWEARPDNIMHGKGCPGCRYDKVLEVNKKRSTKAATDFVEKANTIHDNRYDYSQVEYLSVHEKIKILCPEHGEFWQSPANHLSGGNGCPDCTEFGYRISKPGWLYLQMLDDKFIKIGITNHTPERRMKEHNRNSQLSHKIIENWFFDDGNIPLNIETTIKREFECGVVSSDIMEDGHSETMYKSELPEVLEIVRRMIKNLDESS